ncbi:nickel pincer cofactor biosynthesis protein LarC [Sorangium sp. So ce295]|uniref:nickel pincer cofactor biosynthesis protein LarC n=1 Tax=Sorangium sp. So ce295 TaxID=3133295 RepID=UPI003F5E3693
MGHGHDHDHAHGDAHGDELHHGGHHDHGHGHESHHDHGHGHEGHHDHGHAHGGHHDHGLAHEGHHVHAHGGHHDHGHAHDHPRAPLLEEGAGTGKVLFFDAFSGIAGDMTIAALLDLGVPLLVIERAVAALPLDGFHLHRGHAHRSGIVATSFDVHVEAPQPERTYGSIDAMLAAAPLDPPVAALARRIFRRLGEAEAAVHRIRLEDVHFHEVGAVDAIVDIVGAAAAIVHIGAEVVGSPLPMGRGFVKARHGILPLPPPAAVACLRGVPTYGVELDAELVTPTGAAIIATLATRFERWPTFAPDRIGFGAGQRELPDRPNLLRVVLGTRTGGDESLGSASHVIVEANVDDLTGEVAGHAIEALFAAGALDAWAAPITMKKGRPALTIAALAAAPQADAVATALLRETTSIGLRKIPVARTERPRRIITVQTAYGAIRVKISEGPFGPPQIKPEFDDCAAAARTHGVPVREVVSAALSAAKG